jgi:hypothetical protein
MTNQNTALKEQERDSERVRLHTPTTPSATAPSSSVKNEILELSNKQQRLDNENFSPSPPSRVPSSPGSALSALYQKKLTTSASASATTTSVTGSSSHHIDSIIKEEPTFNDHRTHHQRNESMEDDDDDDENVQMKNEVGELLNNCGVIYDANILKRLHQLRSQYDSQSFNSSAKLNIIVKHDVNICEFNNIIIRHTIISLHL